MLPKLTIRKRQNVWQCFYGQSMALEIACSNPRIVLGKADFVLLMKAQITRKKITLPVVFRELY